LRTRVLDANEIQLAIFKMRVRAFDETVVFAKRARRARTHLGARGKVEKTAQKPNGEKSKSKAHDDASLASLGQPFAKI
jgi:hypothetical protein